MIDGVELLIGTTFADDGACRFENPKGRSKHHHILPNSTAELGAKQCPIEAY